jgi:hypothetical protein
MKSLFVAVGLLFSLSAFAQGSLQFGQAVIVTANDGIVTVPANKVWKVMSVFGEATADGQCYQLLPYCVSSSWPASSTDDLKVKGFKVNGKVVWRAVEPTFDAVIYYQQPNCTGSTTQMSGYANCANYVNNDLSKGFDELAASLPFWVPTGATLECLGSDTFISLIEFNIIP